MYVCVCRAVTEDDVRREAGRGAVRLQDLVDRLGICVECGRCGRHASETLADELKRIGGKAAGSRAGR